jgi:hypothetical protein
MNDYNAIEIEAICTWSCAYGEAVGGAALGLSCVGALMLMAAGGALDGGGAGVAGADEPPTESDAAQPASRSAAISKGLCLVLG